MAGRRKLTRAESAALTAVLVFLFKGYFSSLAWKNRSGYVISAIYAVCLSLAGILAMLAISAMPAMIISLAAAIGFAFYHSGQERADFERRYQEHHSSFAPAYNAHYALPAGRNKIYAYTIAGKEGFIKVGQTIKRTDDRILTQLRTADIRPVVLWEIYSVTQSGRQFTDHNLHSFLVCSGYKRVKAANGRNTEWFQIGKEDLHKEVYRFYVSS